MNFNEERERLIKQRKIIISIDPSFIKMGVCIYDPKEKNPNKAMKLNMGEMMDMVKWINKNCKMSEIVAVVENPDLDSNVFGMWGMMKKEIVRSLKKMDWNGMQSVFLRCMKIASDVGKSKASGVLIIKMLRERGVPVLEVKPSERDKAFKKEKYFDGGEWKEKIVRLKVKMLKMPTKTTQAQFLELTGYKGRSSEDARDAATLIFGRSLLWVINSVMFEKQKNKNVPSSYPTTENGNEFLVNGSKKIF